MKTVAENFAEDVPRQNTSLDLSSHDLPLARIVDDLRGLYHDMTEVDQPSDLRDLAGRVDELISGRSSGTT